MTGTVEQFKAGLDHWLSTIPDQPTIARRQRAAKTNSLLDQVQYVQMCQLFCILVLTYIVDDG